MKKLLTFLLSTVLVLGVFGSASAVPTTWTDHIDFNPDILIPPTHSYYHDIGDGDDGFSSWWTDGDDTIDSFSLELGIYDDAQGYTQDEPVIVDWFFIFPIIEWQEVEYPDGDETGYVSFGLEYQEISFETGVDTFSGDLTGRLDLFHDGTLNVWVSASEGDFYLASSTLTVYGDDGTTIPVAPVPEPATILLMGVGLLGMAGFSRKRFFNKG